MAPDIGGICRMHIAFMQWADELILEAVMRETPEDIDVLQHVYLAEVVWMRRLQGHSGVLISHFSAPPDADSLRAAWTEIHREWREWAAALQSWETNVPHLNSAGREFHLPAWQIALHVANHGSYHRGQASAKLRAQGIAPPSTDLILWYRAQARG